MSIARPDRPVADRDRERSVHRRTMNNNPAPIAAVPMSKASTEAPPVLGSSPPLGIVERITPSLGDGVLLPAVLLALLVVVFAPPEVSPVLGAPEVLAPLLVGSATGVPAVGLVPVVVLVPVFCVVAVVVLAVSVRPGVVPGVMALVVFVVPVVVPRGVLVVAVVSVVPVAVPAAPVVAPVVAPGAPVVLEPVVSVVGGGGGGCASEQ